MIKRIIQSEDKASEVLQDAFLKIWEKIDLYDPSKARLYTWMMNLTRNLAIDKTRSREYSNEAKTDGLENIVYQYDHKNFDELVVDSIGIDTLLTDLTDDQKEVIDLVYFKGYSHSQIATKLDLPLGTIKSRIKAGLARLKNILAKEN